MPAQCVELQGWPWYYAEQKGDGPQEAAMRDADEKKHLFMVVLEFKRNRHYSSFPDAEKFFLYYKAWPLRRCFFQIDRSVDKTPELSSALYLDIEWYTPCHDARAQEKIQKIRDAIEKVTNHLIVQGVVEDLSREDSGKIKNSFHLYYPAVRFQDNRVMKDWLLERIWINKLQNDPQMMRSEEDCPGGESIIDWGVYTKNRAFRLPGSSKEKNYRQLPFPERDFFLRCVIANSAHTHPVTVFWEKNTQKNIRAQNLEPQKTTTTTAASELVQAIVDAARALVPEMSFRNVVGRYINFNRDRPGRCLLCEREHENDNSVFVFLDEDGIPHLKCRRNTQGKHIPLTILAPLEKPKEDRSSRWTTPDVRVTFHSEDGVLPIEPQPTTRLFVIRAGMKMYKTTRSRELVEKKYREGKVLVVSTRIALSVCQEEWYPCFTHYRGRQFSSPQQIIQYESLHHLEDYHNEDFDLVILDETRSLMSNLCCIKTNNNGGGQNVLNKNYQVLKRVLQNAALTLAMDADMDIDGSAPHFLQSIFMPAEIEVHCYTFVKMTRQLVLTTLENDWLNRIRTGLESGQKTTILCRTKHLANAYALLFTQYDPLVITLETPDEVIRVVFRDINKALASRQLMLSTSKMTVGTSVDIPWDRVFVDFRGNSGCCARNMMQMIGRFRELTDTQVHTLCDDTEEKPRPWVMQKARAYMVSRKELTREYLDMLAQDPEFDETAPVHMPDEIGRIYVFEKAEELQERQYALCELARRKGWTVVVEAQQQQDDTDRHSQAMWDALKEHKSNKKEIDEKAFESVRLLSAEQRKELNREIERCISAQRAEFMMKRQAAMIHIMDQYKEPLSLTEIQSAEKYRSAIHRYAMFKATNLLHPNTLLRKDVNEVKFKPWIEAFGQLGILGLQRSVEMFDVLGIANIDSFGTEIPEETFNDNAVKLRQLTKDCAEAAGHLYRDPKNVASGVKKTFKAIWGTTLKQKRRGANHDRISYIYTPIDVVVSLAAKSAFPDRLQGINHELRFAEDATVGLKRLRTGDPELKQKKQKPLMKK